MPEVLSSLVIPGPVIDRHRNLQTARAAACAPAPITPPAYDLRSANDASSAASTARRAAAKSGNLSSCSGVGKPRQDNKDQEWQDWLESVCFLRGASDLQRAFRLLRAKHLQRLGHAEDSAMSTIKSRKGSVELPLNESELDSQVFDLTGSPGLLRPEASSTRSVPLVGDGSLSADHYFGWHRTGSTFRSPSSRMTPPKWYGQSLSSASQPSSPAHQYLRGSTASAPATRRRSQIFGHTGPHPK